MGLQRAPTLLQQDGNCRQGQVLDEQSLPDSGRKHSLQFGYSSVDGDEELDVVESHGSGHGLGVVFVVDAQVSACRVTAPAHCKV